MKPPMVMTEKIVLTNRIEAISCSAIFNSDQGCPASENSMQMGKSHTRKENEANPGKNYPNDASDGGR